MSKFKKQNQRVRREIGQQLLSYCLETGSSLEEIETKTGFSTKALQKIFIGSADYRLNVYVSLAAALGKQVKITFE